MGFLYSVSYILPKILVSEIQNKSIGLITLKCFLHYFTTIGHGLLLTSIVTDDDKLMMNCFCGINDQQKGFSLISSGDHFQRSSLS